MDFSTVIIFIFLFLFSAFFGGSENVFVSIPSHKVKALIKTKKFGTKSLKKVMKDPDKILVTVLILNNLSNIVIASYGTLIAMGIAETLGFNNPAVVISISTFIITILILLFGEIIPKSIGTKYSAELAPIIAPFYRGVMIIGFPIIRIFEKITKIFSKDRIKQAMTEEEIDSFIEAGKESGGIDEDEHERIKSILEFDDITVEEIMVPRVKMDAMNVDLTVEKAMTYFLSHTHTRIPVYSGTIDKIDYFVTSRDLIREIRLGNEAKKLSELRLKEVLKVPLNQSISMLLESLQKSYKTMAIVVDEYGGVAGLVTIEDIMEQVFGEIRDETDKESEEFIKMGENGLLVESDVLIEDVLDKFGLTLTDTGLDENELRSETVSYVITHVLDRFPKIKETLKFQVNTETKAGTLEIRVLELIDETRIGKVEVRFVEKKPEVSDKA